MVGGVGKMVIMTTIMMKLYNDNTGGDKFQLQQVKIYVWFQMQLRQK